jgi:sulfite reductase alpha subunit-like flavoprotein
MSQWIIGGDGWAYDIGFGGLDHVLSRGENVNVMVLDTEMYSNTGGQLSKSTPTSAEVKFASTGKPHAKKDLGQMAIQYENVYVANVAMGADYAQTLKAIKEAEEYPGTSLITCYSPCIDWGLDMKHMMQIQKTAVDSGYWTLYRYDPRNHGTDKPAFQLDSRRIKLDLEKYLTGENRFRKLMRNNKEHASMLQEKLDTHNKGRHEKMVRMSLTDEDLLDMLKERVGESTGEKVTILYASETGTTEQLAQQLQYEFKRREVRTQVMAYDDIDVMDLPKHSTVINLVATCGQGEWPANSKLFWEQIQDPELPTDLLANTKFSTFCMGDSHYVFFNECGKQMDSAFERLGGQRMMPMEMGDDQDDDMWESKYVDWEPALFNELGTMEPPRVLLEASHLVNIDSGAEKEVENVISHHVGAASVPLTRADLITPGGRENIHYEFDMGNIEWECGDCLGVYPHALKSQVDEFCDWYGVGPDEVLRLTDQTGLRKPPLPDNLTAGQLFGQVLDVFGRPKRRFYDMLEMVATDEGQKKELAHLLTKDGAAQMKSDFVDETMHHADLLRKFDSAKVPIEYLIDFVPVIKPRLYSIASASKLTKENLHLCIVADDWDTPQGKYQHGMCTNYLKNLDVAGGGVEVAVKVNPAAVTMPPNFQKPMMMCGLGTGYAPFRAFMQERLAAKQEGEDIGPMSLFFGARHQATEFLYEMPGSGAPADLESEISMFQNEGVLTELRTAFSRDQEHKIYVQNRMQEEKKMIYEYLVEQEGYFYLCGPSGPIVAVREAVEDAIVECGGKTKAEAIDYVQNMQITGRYNIETW